MWEEDPCFNQYRFGCYNPSGGGASFDAGGDNLLDHLNFTSDVCGTGSQHAHREWLAAELHGSLVAKKIQWQIRLVPLAWPHLVCAILIITPRYGRAIWIFRTCDRVSAELNTKMINFSTPHILTTVLRRNSEISLHQPIRAYFGHICKTVPPFHTISPVEGCWLLASTSPVLGGEGVWAFSPIFIRIQCLFLDSQGKWSKIDHFVYPSDCEIALDDGNIW